ncbi:hypothetical protein KY284_002830 [Solanum tuberosum]|nr:hypothetical protein KY284_002830 [Solanum tuberosum]
MEDSIHLPTFINLLTIPNMLLHHPDSLISKTSVDSAEASINVENTTSNEQDVADVETEEDFLEESTSVAASFPDTTVTAPRRSARTKNPPSWLKYFVSLTATKDVKYPLEQHMSIDHLSPVYQCYIAAISTLKEPTTFSEAVKDHRWVDVM